MGTRLLRAARKGDVAALLDLLQEDELILHTVTMAPSQTPLHTAALLGHTEFARVVVNVNPKLAGDFNQHRVTPIHLASSQGYLEIVEDLLRVNSGLCLLRDSGGRTPLHCASMKGRLNVLPVLLSCCPVSAQERTWSGETVLHLAVKNCNLEALIFFIHHFRNLGLDDAFVNSKDKEGDTILHIATAGKQLQIVEFLVNEIKVDVNAVNSKGWTALDVLLTCPTEPDEEKIAELLKSAGGQVNNPPPPAPSQELHVSPPRTPLREPHRNLSNSSSSSESSSSGDWYRNAAIILCVMFATLAFEVALNPPGGLWQDWDSNPTPNSIIPGSEDGQKDVKAHLSNKTGHFPLFFSMTYPNVTGIVRHMPGKAIAREVAKKDFYHFLFYDGMCFFMSLITIGMAVIRTDPDSHKIMVVLIPSVLISAAALYLEGIKLVTDKSTSNWLFWSVAVNLFILDLICVSLYALFSSCVKACR